MDGKNGKNKDGFDRLDKWIAGPGATSMPTLRSWWIHGLLRLPQAWLGSMEPWRSNPPLWKAYRLMARERAETLDRWRSLKVSSNPMWHDREAQSIHYAGNAPVLRACQALLLADCPADFAPEQGLPTAREVLVEWAEWFDAEYNPEEDASTGAPLGWAKMRVEATLAEMEARLIAKAAHSAPLRHASTSGRL